MSIESELAKYMKKLNGNVSLKRLFGKEFISLHSQLNSIEDLFLKAGIIDQASFDNWIPEERDQFIKSQTNFSNWDEMKGAAAKIFVKEKQLKIRNGSWVKESFSSGHPFDNIHIYLSFSAK